MDYSAGAYWEQQSFGSRAILDDIAEWMGSERVSPLQEVAEHAVGFLLEKNAGLERHSIYSPERTYQVGETLAFLGPTGLRRALVVYIEGGHQTRIGGADLPFDKIVVRFRHTGGLKPYASNCPNFPTRFVSNEAQDVESHHDQVLTPGQIVMKSQSIILSAVKEALEADDRFCTFDGHDWMLSKFLRGISEGMIRKVVVRLRESESASPAELANLLFRTEGSVVQRDSSAFSVSYHLSHDSERRFSMSRALSGMAWMLTPPPKQVVCTLDEDMISNGRVRVSGEFQKIVDFYGMTSVLNIQVYGGYLLRALYDQDLRLIYGEDIRSWLEENRLSPKHRVHLRCPQTRGGPLILFSEFEVYPTPEPDGGAIHEHHKLFLRHRIYEVMQGAGEWLHYREIHKRLNESGLDVNPQSVIAILSANGHLFCRREPTRGLWGLSRWQGRPSAYPVNIQSLAITIGEEKWVRRVLDEEGAPLTSREIIRRLSEAFVVRQETIQLLTVIDAADPDFTQLADGRWILPSWIPKWRTRLEDCEEQLARCADLRRQVAVVSRQIEAWHDRLRKLEELSITESSKAARLSDKVAKLRDEIAKADSERRSRSQDIRSLESDTTTLENRRRRLVLWRWVLLLSCAASVPSLLFLPRGVFKMLPLVVSGAAAIGCSAWHRGVLRTLSKVRERLDREAASALVGLEKIERAKQGLTEALNEHASVLASISQLNAEQYTVISKSKAERGVLSSLEEELKHMDEISLRAECNRLRELLISCSEVTHD